MSEEIVSLESAQMVAGKSFEYAILTQFYEKLSDITNVEVIKNSSYSVAKFCFNALGKTKQGEYLLFASFAVNFLIDIEPRLSNDIGSKDVLQLELLSDFQGRSGDVRDVLAIRLLQKWEIGVSAKNNHLAVKHSRLSGNIDFGKAWLGIEVSEQYFQKIGPIFHNLADIRKRSGGKKEWKSLGDYHRTVYQPILKAFIEELERIYRQDPKTVAATLVSYLIGNKDFYKVIKLKNCVEIHAYNINGTLNLNFKNKDAKYRTPKISLPTKIEKIYLKEDNDTTAIVKLNNSWSLSFRIHNASSRIEPSLKFDIQLLDSPKNLFKNTLNIGEEEKE